MGRPGSFVKAAIGIEFKWEDITNTVDRIHTVERAFNIRQGITIEYDSLPQKPKVKRSPEGEKQRKAHAKMVRAYYEKHRYDPATGVPLPATFNRLGISNIGQHLNDDGPYPLWNGPYLWDLDAYPKSGLRE